MPVFTTAEIIALVALIASSSVSIITVTTQYLQNKANINAKRGELAFEKRIDAFQVITDYISRANQCLTEQDVLVNHIGLDAMYNDGDEYIQGESQVYEVFRKLRSDFLDTYYKKRLYLPPNIDKKIKQYVDQILPDAGDEISYPSIETLGKLIEEAMQRKEKLTEEIFQEMHRFVGYR
jgi:hypothetical protein